MKGHNCPACAGKAVHSEDQWNSMAESYPWLAEEFHPTKNGDINPRMIMPSTMDEWWWICKVCGKDFEQRANNRVNRQGCPKCAKTGFNKEKPAFLYLLEYRFQSKPEKMNCLEKIYDFINKKEHLRYKIGITNREVEKRVRYQLSPSVNVPYPSTEVTIIDKVKFSLGRYALDEETKFKRMAEIKCTPEHDFDGKTEMFSTAVFQHWNIFRSNITND